MQRLFTLRVKHTKYRKEAAGQSVILESKQPEDYLYLKTLIDELMALVAKESKIPENEILRTILKNKGLLRPSGKKGFSIEYNSFKTFILIAISRPEFLKEWPVFQTMFTMLQESEEYLLLREKHKKEIKELKKSHGN